MSIEHLKVNTINGALNYSAQPRHTHNTIVLYLAEFAIEVTFPSLTMMHHSFQSLDDGLHCRIVFLPQLQEMSRDKGLQKGLQD